MKMMGFASLNPSYKSLGIFGASLTLAQIIVGSARFRACRRPVGIELLCADYRDTAVIAHLQQLDARARALIHPVLPTELGNHAVDRALHAERLAAARTGKRLLLLEGTRHRGGGSKIEPRRKRDHLFGAGCLAK